MKRDAFASDFMTWAGVSSRGKQRFESLTKVQRGTLNYYINEVMKPLLAKYVQRYVAEGSRGMPFHQDSASSHTSKQTQCFKIQQINFIREDAEVTRCRSGEFWHDGCAKTASTENEN